MTKGGEEQKKVRAKKRLYLDGYKAQRGCKGCGETDPVVLDFHHIDPRTKDMKPNEGDLRRQRAWTHLSWAHIESELAKCEVLCANCHRREEHRRRTA